MAISSTTLSSVPAPLMGHASSRAVSVATLAGPCRSVMTVVSISGTATEHPKCIETANKTIKTKVAKSKAIAEKVKIDSN